MGMDKNKRAILTPGMSDGVGDSKFATLSLTVAQIQGMNGTPVSVLPAVAANVSIIIDHIIFEVKGGSAAFSGGGTVQFQYHVAPNTVVHTGTIAASVLTGASNSSFTRIALFPGFGSSGFALTTASGIDIANGSAAFTGGTGATINVYIKYRKINF